MTGQHVHVIPYKYTIFGQRHVGSRIKKKKDTKAYSTYKSWLIFFRADSSEFSKSGNKETQ